MCTCIERVNGNLRGSNKQLTQNLIHRIRAGKVFASPVVIQTEDRITHKVSKVPLFAKFCPFCGERYPDLGDDMPDVTQGRLPGMR